MLSVEDLSALSISEKELFLKHCVFSGRMRRLWHVRLFLNEEICAKRSVFKRKKFKISDQKLDKLYSKFVYAGKDRIFNPYQCILDGVVFREIHNTGIEQAVLEADSSIKLLGIYFDPKFPIQEMQDAAQFDELEWSLKDPSTDFAILQRFRDELMEFMLDAERLVNPKEAKELRKERMRYERICGYAEFFKCPRRHSRAILREGVPARSLGAA